MMRADALDEIFANPEVFGCRFTAPGSGVLDAGVAAPGGWMAGRALVLSLLSGFADVNFGQLAASGQLVPTLDVFLDDAAGAALALAPDGDGTYGGASSAYRFLPAAAPANAHNTVLAAPHSMVAHLFEAGTALPREVRGLLAAGFCKEEINWGFSSAPVVLRALDDAAAAAMQARVLGCGQMVSVWLRGADEELRGYLEAWGGPGELRLHNLLSGNTFIGGKLDEEGLAACLA